MGARPLPANLIMQLIASVVDVRTRAEVLGACGAHGSQLLSNAAPTIKSPAASSPEGNSGSRDNSGGGVNRSGQLSSNSPPCARMAHAD